ncbi:MAG: sensor histidine kinase [Gaiellaceae bacterium]
MTAIVVAGTAALALQQGYNAREHPLGALPYTLIVIAGLVLAFRHVAPLATFTITLGCALAYEAWGFPGSPAPLPVIVAIYTIASAGERQRALGLSLLATVALVVGRGLSGVDGWGSALLVAFPIAVVGALYVGQLFANQHARRLEMAEQAEQAERGRERDLQTRVDAERLRIARELHDVVAHNISLISVQATMGDHLINERPEQAAAALVAIKGASKEALRELRRILDVLRQPDEREPTAPAPGLDELEALLVSIRHAGLPARLHVLGSPRPLPATVDVAAFRIIQESLTNALRYSNLADTAVTVAYKANSLTVEISDDGAPAPTPVRAGHGIAGMRERAQAVGGTLAAGSASDRGFCVRAEFPVLEPMA